MIDQAAAIAASKTQNSAAVEAPLKMWQYRLLLLLICGGAGLLSVILGPDNYWDLRYYHLYAPWAYLHDRYLYDIGPAQEQGFLNPTADFLFYGLISSPLNEAPRIVAFIMGAVHGINAALLFTIACRVLRPFQPLERSTLRAAAWLMGVSGAGFVSLLGTASNDLTSSLFVLASLLGILKAAEPAIGRDASGRGMWRGFAWAGLWAGIGIGLKYTSALYAPGLGIVMLLAAARRRTTVGVIAFGVVALLAFLAVAGHHMLTLWRDFGNPTFPYLNQIFHSPYWESATVGDTRFRPHGLLQLIAYPFWWTQTDTYIVSEPAFRDWRAAIAYVAMAAGLLAFAARYVGNGYRRDGASAQTRGLDLVFIFVIVSYFAWVLGFAGVPPAYYRYATPLEMLTGIVTIGAVIWLFEDRRLRLAAAVGVVAIAGTTTVYLDWGRLPYGDRYIDVHVPPLPMNSVVLIATWDPVAFFIPFAEPSAQYLGIENNYLEISQNNKLASEVKRIMRTPGRTKFVLSVDAFNSEKLNNLLGQFGLRLGALPCLPIQTNLVGHALSLCPVADG
jgi:hypothetical protein